MIRITNIKLNVNYEKADLEAAIKKTLRLSYVPKYSLSKLSIDSRKKNNVFYVAAVDVSFEDEAAEAKVLARCKNNKYVTSIKPITYTPPTPGNDAMNHRPIIVGSGPAGLFAGLMLARSGYKPIILERGMDVDARTKAVEGFWSGKAPLNKNCNVQFGEGGAGTFSDGKLNSVVKDKDGRRTLVLKTFAEHGASETICYSNKPHIGTDVLRDVVKSMRREIESHGGEVRFNAFVEEIADVNKSSNEVTILVNGERLTTNALVLAIGHSARDTFEMLHEKGFTLEQKPFAMGLRIEHTREFIDKCQYGDNPEYVGALPAADYKLTYQATNGRAVYSFCMCPGGYVVNASSELGRTCVNGMSYANRNGKNSNSAIVANVTPADFGSDHPLAGMNFQRELEGKAFNAGNGKVPVQRFGDFKQGIKTEKFGDITPQIKGEYALSNLSPCLPEPLKNAIIEGLSAFDRIMPGFGADDAILSGVEARTSSPVRITRDETFVIPGTAIYPCGEGAGYAGGITSAAVDGIRVAEAIISKFSNERLK